MKSTDIKAILPDYQTQNMTSKAIKEKQKKEERAIDLALDATPTVAEAKKIGTL